MSKVIVTGGAGFIGSHLVNALVEKGLEVAVVDTLVSGRRENINPAAVLHEIDIRDQEKLTPLFKGASFIFHMAALPRVQPSILDPRNTHDVNVNGTLSVLLAARDSGIKRVIYSASSSAYGDQDVLPLKEDMTPKPMSPYALQKHIGELYCTLFSKLYSLETVSLRYFNVYGPGAPTEGAYAMMMAIFLMQRKNGKPLTIVPDGHQSRAFTHVKDIVRANILAMESSKAGNGEVINVAGKKKFSVLEIADMIGGPKVFIEPRIEPKNSLADLTKAKELLGWEPHIELEDGIAELKELYGIS